MELSKSRMRLANGISATQGGMATRKNILIYRLGSLGDTVVALPCFHLLARIYANHTRILLTNVPVHAKAPAAWAVLGESGLIHDYISYSAGTRNIVELAKLCLKLRRLKIDTVVYLTPSRGRLAIRRDELFFRLCGVREIIGLPRGELATHRYSSVTGLYEAEASRLARCVASIGDACLNDRASWDLELTSEERTGAASALLPLHNAPFLALGIASKKNVTDWGIENWKNLMPRLHQKFSGHALAFIGAKEDHSTIEDVVSRWPGRFINLCGKLSPRESAAVIQKADLYLGLDSGPMHLASTVGTTCLSVSPAHKLPGIWFPFGDAHEIIYHKTECFGCNLDVCTLEKKKCIMSISVDEVIARAVLAGNQKKAIAHRQDHCSLVPGQ